MGIYTLEKHVKMWVKVASWERKTNINTVVRIWQKNGDNGNHRKRLKALNVRRCGKLRRVR